ncbi:uncharacterized protein CIMG_03227 [Coccidioides immitis RS]|uniref:Uncharacterized protein n=3 Tax=Coccidioides immitis TaxID=5501 RepID=J3KAW9_COCIM|nr:uncharacterized protein CIMG_03227 [Coccidioides immitis RS]EAS32203.3 hypothetical protein CIMG_03227 [Coccidioides immitis RS]KMP07412.1 hypothetical protein CIRG_07093 [Coccidioides immitis RMSCC 2394]KMU82493.1 hypothetical protein CIHG_00275 [Coccidioides immitis H538.4]
MGAGGYLCFPWTIRHLLALKGSLGQQTTSNQAGSVYGVSSTHVFCCFLGRHRCWGKDVLSVPSAESATLAWLLSLSTDDDGLLKNPRQHPSSY